MFVHGVPYSQLYSFSSTAAASVLWRPQMRRWRSPIAVPPATAQSHAHPWAHASPRHLHSLLNVSVGTGWQEVRPQGASSLLCGPQWRGHHQGPGGTRGLWDGRGPQKGERWWEFFNSQVTYLQSHVETTDLSHWIYSMWLQWFVILIVTSVARVSIWIVIKDNELVQSPGPDGRGCHRDRKSLTLRVDWLNCLAR